MTEGLAEMSKKHLKDNKGHRNKISINTPSEAAEEKEDGVTGLSGDVGTGAEAAAPSGEAEKTEPAAETAEEESSDGAAREESANDEEAEEETSEKHEDGEEYDEEDYDDYDDDDYDDVDPKKRRIKRLITAGIVILVLLLAAGAVYYFFLRDRSQMSVSSLVDEFRDKYLSSDLVNDGKYLESMGLKLTERPFDKGNYGIPVYNDCLITDEFIKEYVSKYPATDLLMFILNAQPNIQYRDQAQGYGEECKIYNDIINTLENNTDFWMGYRDVLKLHGAEGYYGAMTDEVYNVAVRGDFVVPGDPGKTREESKTNLRTVKYYGDWKIVEESGYQYDPGIASSTDGQLYDVAPSWKHFVETVVYYKDTKITDDTDFSFTTVSNSNGEINPAYLKPGEYVCLKITVHPAFEDIAYGKLSEFMLLSIVSTN